MRLSENSKNNTCETLITQLYTTTLKVNSYFLALFNDIIFLFSVDIINKLLISVDNYKLIYINLLYSIIYKKYNC